MMSGVFNRVPPIPRETVRTAKAVFGSDNFYMRVGDRLDSIVAGIQLESLPASGDSEPLFPLVTFFQALESLIDSQAMDALRARLDWKYALHMPVHVPMWHERALCDFRCKVISDALADQSFQNLMERLITLKPPFGERRQNIKRDQVIPIVCLINNVAALRDAIQQAVETLAFRYPEWLQKNALPHWYGRFSGLGSGFGSMLWTGDERSLMEESIADIDYLFDRIRRSGSLEMLALEEIRTLEQLKVRQSQALSHLSKDETSTTNCATCDLCACQAGVRRQ